MERMTLRAFVAHVVRHSRPITHVERRVVAAMWHAGFRPKAAAAWVRRRFDPDTEQAMPTNHDFDRTYVNPAAWRKAKEAFGRRSAIGRAMEQMETLGGLLLRDQLHCALVHWINLGPEGRSTAVCEPTDLTALVAWGNARIEDRNWWIRVSAERLFVRSDDVGHEVPYTVERFDGHGAAGKILLSPSLPLSLRAPVLAAALAEVKGEEPPPLPAFLRHAA